MFRRFRSQLGAQGSLLLPRSTSQETGTHARTIALLEVPVGSPTHGSLPSDGDPRRGSNRNDHRAFSIDHMRADRRMMDISIMLGLQRAFNMEGINVRRGHSYYSSMHMVKSVDSCTTIADVEPPNIQWGIN